MIYFVALFSLAEIARQPVSCSVLVDRGNAAAKIAYHQRDENPMFDELPENLVRNESERFRRDLRTPSTTEPSIRASYERAVNQTIQDYYAQRRAVMERYYARQREIIDKFGRKTTTESPASASTDAVPRKYQIVEHGPSATIANAETTAPFPGSLNESRRNDSIASWVNDLTSADSRSDDGQTENDFQSESSNNLANRADRKDIPGYYRLGEFKGSADEKIVYQHNLRVGLKGSSQLEANFEAVLEGAFVITVIEAFPYANTKAHFSWISGGPGSNSVKLKLVGYKDQGFSYTVKVWAVPK
ncbi:uncharacterized protein [Venturia canescens]|uniref:uncharacterized protein n=1 Tax=Venturia canescens TaxID=32260 RepID=UPI001C9CA962|nr:uncharacterized protein LOC122413635 [Venturia canescens]